jgi:putative flippase GtrA
MRKGREPLLYTLSSLSSFLLDTGLFYVLHLLLNAALGVYTEPVCNLAARALSSFYNFNMNRLVFGSRGQYGREMLKYYCLCIPQALVSTGLITFFVNFLRVENTTGAAAVKLTVDAILFVASFFIQKFWVFRKQKPASNGSPETDKNKD